MGSQESTPVISLSRESVSERRKEGIIKAINVNTL